MRLDDSVLCEIFRLRKAEKKSYAAIARATGVSERTVRRRLDEAAKTAAEDAAAVADGLPPSTAKPMPKCMLDRHEDLLRRLAARYGYMPTLVHSHLARCGVESSVRTVQRWMLLHCGDLRKPRRIYNRLFFEPGEAAQTDFGECGALRYGGTTRKLAFCVTVLCRSRLMHAEIVPAQTGEHFLACQRHAFEAFGGAPRKLIVDNCRCAVLSHEEGHVVFNPAFRSFCAHYNVKPVACAPRAPSSKGIVERMVGFVKRNFLSVNTFQSKEEADARLAEWLAQANARVHKALKDTPAHVFETSEKAALLPLPKRPHPCERVEERGVDKYGRVSFDGNFYSVPPLRSGRTATVRADAAHVRVFAEGRLVAEHARSYETGLEIADPRHVEAARRALPAARLQDARADLRAVCGADADAFLEGVARIRGENAGDALRLVGMIRKYGADAFRAALREAVSQNVLRAEYVEFLLTHGMPDDDPAPLRLASSAADAAMDVRTPDVDLDAYSIF